MKGQIAVGKFCLRFQLSIFNKIIKRIYFSVFSFIQASTVQDEIHRLQWQDYLVISGLMLISIVIGIYYRFSGGQQRTTQVSF